MSRCGIGYDVHRLVEGRPLILGGVEIPFPRGLEGHSDADVLCHAICDAVLGAIGAGDIGDHFPDTDPAFRGISSLKLLKRVSEIVVDAGYRVVHVDAVVVAEEPKIGPFKAEMRFRIAYELAVDEASVHIKATTQEGLGALGRGEGIAAWAVATVAALSDGGER